MTKKKKIIIASIALGIICVIILVVILLSSNNKKIVGTWRRDYYVENNHLYTTKDTDESRLIFNSDGTWKRISSGKIANYGKYSLKGDTLIMINEAFDNKGIAKIIKLTNTELEIDSPLDYGTYHYVKDSKSMHH